jgi:hypothetical protein
MTEARINLLRWCLFCGREFVPHPRNPHQLYCRRLCGMKQRRAIARLAGNPKRD